MQHILFPLIVNPVLYKEKYYNNTIISKVWHQAGEALSSCRRLIMIGYSFPPTNFHVKKLFLDFFKEYSLDELIIVNPDTSVVQKVKDVTHFTRPVIVCRDIREYLEYYVI